MMASLIGHVRMAYSNGIAFRLAGGYVLLIGMILLTAAVGMTNIGKIRMVYDQVLDVNSPRIAELQNIQALLSELNVGARDAMITTDAQQRERVFQAIESGRTSAGEKLEALQKSLQAEGTQDAQEVSAAMGDDASTALVGLVKYSRYVKAGKSEMALTTLTENIKPALQRLSSHIARYQQSQVSSLAAVKQTVTMTQRAVLQQTLLIVVVSLLIACAFAYWVVRSVLAPLQDAKAAAGHMAKGDFSRQLSAPHEDEVGQVIVAFNQISQGLSELARSIRGSADQVHIVAETIATRAVGLEQSASAQTGALTTAMRLIEGAQQVIDDNVRVAAEAAGMATNMEMVANSSTRSVLDAAHEMEMVQQSSQKITDIITLIDGIAFQTNILALNAAVEAARAGAQGSGFAVVASEVRSLAGRSAQASREIKDLITNSQARVASGSSKVQSIAGIMTEVTQSSADLKVLVEQISEGSRVQRQQMGEMVASVAQLNAGNDSNLQVVGGLRDAMIELRDMAQSLADKVDAFKTDGA